MTDLKIDNDIFFREQEQTEADLEEVKDVISVTVDLHHNHQTVQSLSGPITLVRGPPDAYITMQSQYGDDFFNNAFYNGQNDPMELVIDMGGKMWVFENVYVLSVTDTMIADSYVEYSLQATAPTSTPH